MMSEKKTDQAMRLMEALDGVDPELLARSEQKKKIIPFQYYARIAAACLALFVAGGVMFVTARNGGALKKEATSDGSNGFSGADMGMNAATQGDSRKNGNAENYAAEGVQEDEARDEYKNEMAESDFYNMTPQEAEAGVSYSDDLRGSQFDGNAASVSVQKEENTTSANESKSVFKDDASLIMKDFLAKLGLRRKGSAETTATREDGKVEVTLGDEAVVCDAASKERIYEYLSELELGEASPEDGAAMRQKEVVLSKVDVDGRVTEWITISGKYLRFDGEDRIYQILNEDYDFDALYAEMERILQEEKE